MHSLRPAVVFDVQQTAGITIYVCAADSAAPGRTAALPAATLPLAAWEEPAYVMEPKYGLPLLQAAFAAIPQHPGQPSTGAAP